jgi:hypothetical protein
VVHVLPGSSAGATTVGSQFWTQAATASGETGEATDHFGSILAIASVRGGTSSSLVIGAHFEDLGGVSHAGVFHVLAGGTTGVTTTGAQLWSQGSPGVPEDLDGNDFFPFALAGR